MTRVRYLLAAFYASLDFPHEWIVVDGGEDSETILWLNSIIPSQITYIREPDKNLYDAMNKGVRFAKGSHLIFINAGDRIYISKEIFRNTAVILNLGQNLESILYIFYSK